jgi:hypothetical protein
MKKQRKVWSSVEFNEQLTAFWRARPEFSSGGDVIRHAIEHLATTGIVDDQLADHDMPGKASVRVYIEDQPWDIATTRAGAAGVSINSAVRRRVIKMMETQ